MIQKGTSIVDFWANAAISPQGVPKVWYDVLDGRFRDYPSYMRCMADGMEGVLDAYTYMKQNNVTKDTWMNACKKFADWLVSVQNSDGSFYRAYNWDGTPEHTGKFNTTNPIRYLTRIYQVTNDKRYLDCAVKAGNYCYDNIYKTSRYVGGTPDNDNVVDKEAGVMAMYAFNSLYFTTGDSKWLAPAENAAIFAASWTYFFAFAVNGDSPANAFRNGGTDGLSFIANGHSGMDTFMAYTYFDYYRLYIATGDKLFLDTSVFMQNNTKHSTDWDGHLNYKIKGLLQESIGIADMNYNSSSPWLPWCTIANVEPMTNMQRAFGVMTVEDAQKIPIDQLKQMMAVYGSGGNKQ